MTTFASVIDLLGNVLMEEQIVEEDRKFEGCCILEPHELGELWSKTAGSGLQALRARGVDDVKDPMKDLVRSAGPMENSWLEHSRHCAGVPTQMPVGWILGILAAVLTWVSEMILVIGFLVRDGSHSQKWAEQYPDMQQRFLTMNNFSHPDSGGLILDRLEMIYSFQGWLVAEGLMESMACLAAICCLMSLKAQMNYRQPADERELVMYACFVIGFLIPLLEFAMRAGPVTFIGWVGSEVAKDKAGSTDMTMFRGFSDTHLQVTMMALRTTESLFTWLNVVADILLGLGFFQLSFIGSKRAKIIVDDKTRLLGLWSAGIFFLTAVFGILRESATFVGDEGWVFFDLAATATSVVLGVFLVPTYFVFLGVGLGKIYSIEDLNRHLSDAVTYIGETTTAVDV